MSTAGGVEQRSTVTDLAGRLAGRFAAEQAATVQFSFASKASSVGISAWFVSALIHCRLCQYALGQAV